MAVQYTYRQLYVEALDYVGLNLADISADPDMLAKARSWPNRALDDLCRYHAWPWLRSLADVTLAAGATSAALPVDFEAVTPDELPILVGVSSGWLVPASHGAICRLLTTTHGGQPGQYSISYSNLQPRIEVDVQADRTYTIRVGYVRSISPMVTDADQPAVPLSYHDLVRLGTLAVAEEEQDRVPQGRMRPLYEQAKQQARMRCVAADPNDTRGLRSWWRSADDDTSVVPTTSKVVIEGY